MKLLLLSSLILSLSTTAMSGEFTKAHAEPLAMSYTGAGIVSIVYGVTGPLAAVTIGGTVAVAVTDAELRAHQQVAAKLLVRDVQDFYLTGSASLNLQASINGLKVEFPDLSDSEAVDVLTQSADLILQ